MNTQNKINKIFSTLDDWRHLPNYQLERRADIFFAIYLDDIIKAKFNHTVTSVIPEFPLRVGDVHSHLESVNKSFKIDYVAFCEQDKILYLVELKTDQGSVRENQINYLEKAKENGIQKLITGILSIYMATSYKSKYDYLINKLIDISFIKKDADKKYIPIENDYSIEIVYILPINDNKIKSNIVTFENIIEFINHHQDDFTQRFIESLKSWQTKV